MATKNLDWKAITNVVAEAKSQAKGLATQLELLLRRREELFHAPPNKADVKNMYFLFINGRIKKSQDTLFSYAKSQFLFNRNSLDSLPHEMAPLSGRQAGNSQQGVLLADHILAAIGSGRLKQWITAMVSGWEEWPGQLKISLEERRAEIQKTDEKIEKIQAELDALHQQMAQHGLNA